MKVNLHLLGQSRPALFSLMFSLLFLHRCLIVSGQSVITSNIPIVVINTNGAEIPDADKIPAKFQIVKSNPNGTYTYDVNNPPSVFELESDIGIEIRGNSSMHWEKKSYGMEMRIAPDGDGKDVSVLGMPAESDWVLNASYGDKSFMRDVLAHEMYRRTGRYSPRTRYVELYMRKTGTMTYRGVYVLMEKIKKSDHRINVKKLTESDADPSKITGGYILQIGEDEEVKFSSDFPGNDHLNFTQGTPPNPIFHIEYPKLHKYTNAANKTLQLNYIKNYIRDFEQALYGENYTNAVTGYRKYIDVDAMIDYMLHEEFVKNSDNWRASAFLYKNRDSEGGLLTMGAPWDFDRAMGNQQWCFEPSVLPTGTWAWQYNQLCDHFLPLTVGWPKRLLSDCYFKEKLMKRFTELRKTVWSDQSIRDFIATQKSIMSSEVTQQSGVGKSASERNFKRWNILSQPVMNNDHFTLANNTYDKEVTYLQDWLITHLTWMDQNLASISSTICSSLPVTFSGFGLKTQESGVLVSWATSAETDNEKFEIERSADARNFTRLGKIDGNGNSGTAAHYEFLDTGPLPGINYYRIRQTDLNGTFSFSAMKSIENKDENALSVIYPNPGFDEVTVKNVPLGASVVIYDHLGRELKSLKAEQKQLSVQVRDLPDGVYQIQISDSSSGFSETHKLIILR